MLRLRRRTVQRTSPPHERPVSARLAPLAGISGAGLVSLALTVLVGFEAADARLLSLAYLAALAAPAGVLVHLWRGTGLTGLEKRGWLGALFGPRAMTAWPEYLTSMDLRASLRRLEAPASVADDE